ncbi:MAG: peptidase domain-containing ABC transporter [Bacteroides sp.]|nr:peptidase domain-containing ABC transporter [Bacteroides sp.]
MFKTYRQLERSDCGITCIRMIARHYGKKISNLTLRRLVETNKLGISLKDLTDTLSKIGMKSAALRITGQDIYRMPCPAIVYWRQQHFVVVYDIDLRRKIFKVADPELGKLRFEEEEFLKYWCGDGEKGIVVVAEPGDDFHKKAYDKKSSLNGLLKLVSLEISKRKRSFLYIILLLSLCMGADILVPLMMQNTVDEGIGRHDIELVWLLIAGQFMVFLGNSAASNAIEYLMSKVGLGVNKDMTQTYLRKIIRFPLSFFDSKNPADLIQKVYDQSRIKDFVMQIPSSTLFVILNMIVFSGLLIWYNGWLFLFFLLLTCLEIGWTFIFMGKRRTLDFSYFSAAATDRNNIHELINGMMEIKASGAHRSRLHKWENTQNQLITLSLKSRLLNIGMSGGQSLIARVKEILITGLCATLVIKNKMTFGEMLTVSYVVGRLSGPFHNIIGMFSSTQDARISYERLEEVLSDNVDTQGDHNYSTPEIRMTNLSFRYAGSSNPYVLKDLSLTIRSGETTAIVGESGCGKTTLIKLMLGFYVPQKGNLYLSGHDIHSLNRDSWLNHCAIVMQSGYLFSDTIAANIALCSDNIDMERVINVARIVGMDTFIDSLPMDYRTLIGPTGIDLSGGQKQRLLIARALYKRPEILFLDEATSSLDARNERLITQRINQLQKGKTLIIAAHRLSTVKNADRILFMENGRIVEDGTHHQLIALKGRYYNLVSNQLELSE